MLISLIYLLFEKSLFILYFFSVMRLANNYCLIVKVDKGHMMYRMILSINRVNSTYR